MNYTVETTDVADAEIDAAFLRLSSRNPDFAVRWLEGLLRAIASLDTFPNRHARAPESKALGRDVKRMLTETGTSFIGFCFSWLTRTATGKQKRFAFCTFGTVRSNALAKPTRQMSNASLPSYPKLQHV